MVGTDQHRTRHDRLCGQAVGEFPMEFAIGRTVRERVRGAVERDDMRESEPVVGHQHLVLDSPGIPGGQFDHQVLS
ncbi:MAG: hypothetical protein JWP83_5690 [Mycobacterium sp.]|nr:hypothetical protein [Mycobacterium sp.]